MKTNSKSNTGVFSRALTLLLLAAAATLGLAARSAGAATLYVSSGTDTIYMVTGTGSTVYATLPPSNEDGEPLPQGLVFDTSGNLYVSEYNISEIGEVTTTGSASIFANLTSLTAGPVGIVFDGSDNLCVADVGHAEIDKISPAGVVKQFASVPDGAVIEGLAIDASGNLYTADFNTGKIYKITPDAVVSHFASLPANVEPFGLAFDTSGNLFVSDANTSQISKITSSGKVSVFATLPAGSGPHGIAFDNNGNLYAADVETNTISKISPDGLTVNTFASGINAPQFIAVGAVPEPVSKLVAAKGDNVGEQPGEAMLSVAGPPAIDGAGDVAFHITVTGTGSPTGSNSGIILYSSTSFEVIAHIGPNSNDHAGPIFTKLSDPVLSGSGAFAFIGTLKTGTNGVTAADDTGVFVAESSTSNPVEVTHTGETAPELSGATFKSFADIGLNDAGGLALLATVSTGTDSPALFATDQSGTLQLITRKGDTFSISGETIAVSSLTVFAPVAGVGGQGRTLDEASGNVAALVKGAGGKIAVKTGVPETVGFTIGTHIKTGGSIPSLPGVTIKSIDEPAVNGTLVAFSALITGTGINAANNSGIGLVTTSGGGSLLVRTSDFAPDASGSATTAVFAKVSDPVLNDIGDVAFAGTLKVSASAGITSKNAAGIWLDDAGTLRQVVRAGEGAPASAGAFTSFQQIALPNAGGLIFEATLSGVPKANNQGVWLATADGLTAVVVAGQLLDVHGTLKTVKSIAIFQQAAEVLGQSRSFDPGTGNLVYEVTFTDGTWGIYEVVFPVAG